MLPRADDISPYRLDFGGCNVIIREMTIDDYDEVYEMWQITTKRALSKADEKIRWSVISSTTPV